MSSRPSVSSRQSSTAAVPAAVLLVDKPTGPTSHDVVARVRRAAGTRRVGHAGTLDPMATGLLVLGVGSATRLLGYFVGLDKSYQATIRLGAATSTDDAEGEPGPIADPGALAAIDEGSIAQRMRDLTGSIDQVPSAVSAIKVTGRRAYELARAGERVELASRRVTVQRFDLLAAHRVDGFIDLDVVVDCSSGTYIRALARDLGAALGVGGHLTRLRRTRVGPFSVSEAASLDEPLGAAMTPATAAGRLFPEVHLDEVDALALRQGKSLRLALGSDPIAALAALDPGGALVGLISWNGAETSVLVNLPDP